MDAVVPQPALKFVFPSQLLDWSVPLWPLPAIVQFAELDRVSYVQYQKNTKCDLRVERHEIIVIAVDAFNDIYLTRIGPVGT